MNICLSLTLVCWKRIKTKRNEGIVTIRNETSSNLHVCRKKFFLQRRSDNSVTEVNKLCKGLSPINLYRFSEKQAADMLRARNKCLERALQFKPNSLPGLFQSEITSYPLRKHLKTYFSGQFVINTLVTVHSTRQCKHGPHREFTRTNSLLFYRQSTLLSNQIKHEWILSDFVMISNHQLIILFELKPLIACETINHRITCRNWPKSFISERLTLPLL